MLRDFEVLFSDFPEGLEADDGDLGDERRDVVNDTNLENEVVDEVGSVL